MSSPHSHIRPNTCLFFRLPSNSLKLIEIKPNTIIDTGRLGTFNSNSLLGRPYHYTYELLEKEEGETCSRLRVVPPLELNAEIIAEEAAPEESRDEPAEETPNANGGGESFDLVGDDGTVIIKNNRLTIDDASRQALSQSEIEELKKSSGGKEIIERILANHAGLEEKTTFSKAKYTLRKSKKYLKRFTALPMGLAGVIEYILEKEPIRILEMRQETLALVTAWSNAHVNAGEPEVDEEGTPIGGGRWLVCDEAGGLLVASLAERMGILYPGDSDEQNGAPSEARESSPPAASKDATDEHPPNAPANGDAPITTTKPAPHRDFPLPASTNTITILHPAVQPNLSLLKYFGYDTNIPNPTHPLHTRLKPLSYLQLLDPSADPTTREPPTTEPETLAGWKSGKRSTYFKKRRRWARTTAIIADTRAGGFDALVVASHMDPASIFPHAVPLVRGGGQVVVYSATAEPLVKLMDLYSKDRRTAYLQALASGQTPDKDDFPVDPRLLLAPSLQTSRVREWQVLPGRTHPGMTGRGGSEGYVFTARKVLPVEGGVEARGNFAGKKRKVG